MKAATKEHMIRSTIAFVIVMCLLTNYSDKQGSATIIDRLLNSEAFKMAAKLFLWSLAAYLAFGKLRSKNT